MELHGEIDLEGTKQGAAMSFFTDLKKVVPCLPNLIDYKVIDDKTIKALFKANVGSISVLEYISRVTADVIIKLDKYSDNLVEYSFEGKAAGIKYTGKIMLNILDGDNLTKVNWNATVDIGKFFDMLARFIDLNELINNMINDIIMNIKQCLSKY